MCLDHIMLMPRAMLSETLTTSLTNTFVFFTNWLTYVGVTYNSIGVNVSGDLETPRLSRHDS